jgi:hypothetical protein
MSLIKDEKNKIKIGPTKNESDEEKLNKYFFVLLTGVGNNIFEIWHGI